MAYRQGLDAAMNGDAHRRYEEADMFRTFADALRCFGRQAPSDAIPFLERAAIYLDRGAEAKERANHDDARAWFARAAEEFWRASRPERNPNPQG